MALKINKPIKYLHRTGNANQFRVLSISYEDLSLCSFNMILAARVCNLVIL